MENENIDVRFYDIDIEWFKARKITTRAAIVVGILSACNVRAGRAKQGWMARATNIHPAVFKPVVEFFKESFPSKMNDATKQQVKSGGNIYRFNKKYIWHLSGREKVMWIINNMGSQIAAPSKVPLDTCKHCGYEDGQHDKECYTNQS